MATPTEIISRFTHEAPVDVASLARALGIALVHESMLNSISGEIRATWSGGYRITVNSDHSPVRRRFTIAHEIAHFVLHRELIGDGIVDDALYRSNQSDEIERQANSYAATILMPAPLVGTAFRAGEKSYAGMAKRFDVSGEVARIRMKELRLG